MQKITAKLGADVGLELVLVGLAAASLGKCKWGARGVSNKELINEFGGCLVMSPPLPHLPPLPASSSLHPLVPRSRVPASPPRHRCATRCGRPLQSQRRESSAP